jgi:predicted transposase YbfD/YdcC
MCSLITILREVRDPRELNARHDLSDMLFAALAATLCGAKSCVEIAEFVEARLSDLREIVPLRRGAPSHDTFSRVFRLLDPEELAAAFTAFMTEFRRAAGLSAPKGVVAIDAKALRRGYEKGRAHMPPLMVSVWDSETRLTIASARAPGGSEVQATLDLLKGLSLKGCTVTADALHCHPAMAKAVRDAKAQYALGLKGNHGPLFAAAEAAFAATGELAVFETQERAHGRSERRSVSVLPVGRLAPRPDFPGLKAIGRIVAERTGPDGRTVSSTRYVALSRPLSPRKLAKVVRAHWTIENQLHWTLDVVFDEDDARTRKDNGPQNLAVIRRLAHNILRAHPRDARIVSKMRRANWDKEFFFELFTHMR